MPKSGQSSSASTSKKDDEQMSLVDVCGGGFHPIQGSVSPVFKGILAQPLSAKDLVNLSSTCRFFRKAMPKVLIHNAIKLQNAQKFFFIGYSTIGIQDLVRASTNTPNLHPSTIGVDVEKRESEMAGLAVRSVLFTSAGQERFRTVTSSMYRGTKAIMLVYDAAQPATLAFVLEQLANKPADVAAVMIGVNTRNSVISPADVERLQNAIADGKLMLSYEIAANPIDPNNTVQTKTDIAKSMNQIMDDTINKVNGINSFTQSIATLQKR